MEVSILSLLASVVLLLAVPVLVGQSVNDILKIEKNISMSFITGYMTIWAFMQIITVPLILMKQSFMMVVMIETIFVAAIIVYGFIRRVYAFEKIAFKNKTEIFFYVIMCICITALLVVTACLQHTDADDARFVVNAVDIVRTNKMFLTDPSTGEELSTWMGELHKDVTSPWAVFIAYASKLTGVHAAIMAHTVLQLVLTLLFCLVYWAISDELFEGDVTHRSIFTIFIIVLNVYGYYSIYSAETFAITRIWQGKAVVAAIGIPFIYLIATKIYKEDGKWGYYILLYMTSFAMCLMSGMGITFAAILTGCIAFVYAILKKNIRIFFKIIMAALPCAAYFVIYTLETKL